MHLQTEHRESQKIICANKNTYWVTESYGVLGLEMGIDYVQPDIVLLCSDHNGEDMGDVLNNIDVVCKDVNVKFNSTSLIVITYPIDIMVALLEKMFSQKIILISTGANFSPARVIQLCRSL